MQQIDAIRKFNVKVWHLKCRNFGKANTTSLHEILFAGQQSSLTLRSLYANSLSLHHYSINSLLYLRTVPDKYIALYRELITQLHIYTSAIRTFVKGYLPISLVTPSKLREILNEVKTAIWTTNPDYDLVIDRIHLYYNRQLVTFGIDKDKNLIIQFLVFIQPYTQQPLILYQLETVPVPIIDQNTQAQSYTHLQVNKPYITLNSETYISIRQQESRTCKRIGYVFYVLYPECNFLHGYFRCQLPVEMLDVEVKVKTMQGIHMFRRDRTSQVINCNPWSTKLCPYP